MRVNLRKIKFIHYNSECDFIQEVVGFLSCGIRSSSFSFLGILISINPRCREVWKSIVDKIRRRLNVWHNRFLSISGRVVLLNSKLANMSIFFFYFYKAPKVIINENIIM